MKYYTFLAAQLFLSTDICSGMNFADIRLVNILNSLPKLGCKINYPELQVIKGLPSGYENMYDKKGSSVKVNPGRYAIIKGILLYEGRKLGVWGVRVPLEKKYTPLLAFASNQSVTFDTTISNSEAEALLTRAIQENW